MRLRFWLALCFSVLAGHSLLQAQTATLSGTIVDPSGAAIPSAQASVANTETGIQRMAQTDERGRFTVPQLSPGSYQLTVTREGFETLVRNGITLTVGQEAILNLTLTMGAVTEQVTVTGEAPLVNTSTSSVSGVVEEKRIEDLPLNGRDFSQLPLVQPGVYALRQTDQTATTKGYGTRVSMAGSRPDQTAWLLDGTNIKSMANFGTPGSAAGVMLGVDAVREFQVLTSNYSAEYGGTSGGVINMVTKSGTNGLHGSLYEYLRNSDLDARSFIDVSKPAFKRNQFGGALGGPIKKDRTFFFGNYEGLRQRLGITEQSTVPDATFHKGILPDGTQLQIAPEIQPYLDQWPLPNGAAVGVNTETARLSRVASSPVNEDYFMTRVDHHLTDKQSIFARFSFDQGNLITPDTLPVTQTTVAAHTRYATLAHDYIVSSQLLMTTRIAYNRTLITSDDGLVPGVDYPVNLRILVARPDDIPTVGISNLNAPGSSSTSVLGKVQNLYQFQESLQYVHGAQSMKFGVDIEHVGYATNGGLAGYNASFSWQTMKDYLLDNPLFAFGAQVPGGSSFRSFVQYVYGAYFQDDWRIRKNFTLNVGLRYEPFTTPVEKHGRISVVPDWVHATQFETNVPFWKNPSKKDFSPRVGFAWDPQGDGKTAVRGGFGIFFVDLLGATYGTPASKDPPYYAAIALPLRNGQGTLATAVSDVAAIGPSLLSPVMNSNSVMEITQYDLNPSYEMKANLTVERQFGGNLSLAAGYLGGRGFHLWENNSINVAPSIQVDGRPFVVAGTPVVNPNSGSGTTRYSEAQSFYNGLQLGLKKTFSRGLQFQVAYTWSKNIDDATTGVANTDFGEGVGSQPYNRAADRGLSALNVGQNLVINDVYLIPTLIKSGFVSHFFDGWQVSNILTASQGTPFSPMISGRNAPNISGTSQRPDLIAGRNSGNMESGTTAGCTFVNGVPGPVNLAPSAASQTVLPGQQLGTASLFFDPCAFFLPPAGFYGNAGRNILNGPGYLNFDISLVKSTPLRIKEGSRLEFRADFFNLFNHTHFANPAASVLNATNRQYVSTVALITKPAGSSRQMQFGLKIVF